MNLPFSYAAYHSDMIVLGNVLVSFPNDLVPLFLMRCCNLDSYMDSLKKRLLVIKEKESPGSIFCNLS